jgi:hypothetical protein
VSELSRALPTVVGGRLYTFLTRYHMSGAPVDLAEQYLFERLAICGYSPTSNMLSSKGVAFRSVVAEIRGTTHLNEVVVIGPRLDGYPAARAPQRRWEPTTTPPWSRPTSPSRSSASA